MVSKTTKNWFVQTEKKATMADFDDLNDGILSPRSSLKIIDETLVYELCRGEEWKAEEE